MFPSHPLRSHCSEMSREEKAPSEAGSKMQQDLLNDTSLLPGSSAPTEVPEAKLVDPKVVERANIPEQTPESTIVMATLVEPVSPTTNLDSTALLVGKMDVEAHADQESMPPFPLRITPPIPGEMDNVAAVGGAVAAIVLGVWALLGAFITPWSGINAMLGLVLGSWGITSRYRRLAWVGIVFCLIGAVICVAQNSEAIDRALTPPPDENL